MKLLTQQIVTDVTNHKQIAYSAYGVTASTGLATALELIPLVVGVIVSIISLLGASALLYHTLLTIKITKRKERDRNEREGKKERYDDED